MTRNRDDINTRDRFIYPYRVSSEGLVFVEGGVDYFLDLQFNAGLFWPYSESGLAASFTDRWPSLYKLIEDKINASGCDGTYEFIAAPASESPNQGKRGLALRRTADGGAPATFGWAFTDPLWDFPPELLGFRGDADVTTAAAAHTVLFSSYTRSGDWVSPRRTSRKMMDPRKLGATAGSAGPTRLRLTHRTDRIRPFQFNWIPAGHVRRYRNDEHAYARVADMGLNDHGNYFESLWESMAEGNDIIVVHDTGDLDLEVTSHQWEVGTLLAGDEVLDFADVIELQAGGERYGIEFAMWMETGFGNYRQ